MTSQALREMYNADAGIQETRKIIFVAHSLGGLVAQDALCSSKASPERHLQQVGSSTSGVIFLGTPHCGSDHAAWGALGATIAKPFKRANSNIVSVLKSNSETLARIQDGFRTILRERNDDLTVACFYEELPAPVGGMVNYPKSPFSALITYHTIGG